MFSVKFIWNAAGKGHWLHQNAYCTWIITLKKIKIISNLSWTWWIMHSLKKWLMHDLWGARQQLCLRPSTFYRGVLALCTRGGRSRVCFTARVKPEWKSRAAWHLIKSALASKTSWGILFYFSAFNASQSSECLLALPLMEINSDV